MNLFSVLFHPRDYWEALLHDKLWGSGGESSVLRTVEGVSPLTLLNVASKGITSLVQFGKTTQSGTPNPSAPVDIVCNNGTLKMVDDDLPSGYTRLAYVENAGTGYIDTGIILNTADLDVEVDFQVSGAVSGSPRMAWGFMGNTSSLPRWGIGTYQNAWLGSPNVTTARGSADTNRHTIVMSVYQSGSDYFFNGEIDGAILYSKTTLSREALFLGNDLSSYLFARNNNGTAGNNFTGKIYGFKVTKADALIHDLVPCKNASNAVGFYDLVEGTFHEATGTLIAGAVDGSHSHLEVIGNPEVLSVNEQTASVQNLFAVGDYADTQDIVSGAIVRKCAVMVLDGTEAWSYSNRAIYANLVLAGIPFATRAGLCTHFSFGAGRVIANMADGEFIYNYASGSSKSNGNISLKSSLFSDLTTAKEWLADKYAAGTPVIVVYPLAEETIETVTAQPVSGTGTVTVTANTEHISGIELKAEYWETTI